MDFEWLSSAKCDIGPIPSVAPLAREVDVHRAAAIGGFEPSAEFVAITVNIASEDRRTIARIFGLEPKSARPPAYGSWRLLGYEAASVDRVSLHADYGWFHGLPAGVLSEFRGQINHHNLFREASGARRCAALGNSMCPEEAPFLVFGLWTTGPASGTA